MSLCILSYTCIVHAQLLFGVNAFDIILLNKNIIYIIVLYITYYCCPCYIQCILLLNYYHITIILLLFSSSTSEGVYMTIF